MSQHPEVEARITRELGDRGLLAVQGAPQPRGLQLRDIHDLPYLSAAFKVPASNGIENDAKNWMKHSSSNRHKSRILSIYQCAQHE